MRKLFLAATLVTILLMVLSLSVGASDIAPCCF
jgi:hypothetical protein